MRYVAAFAVTVVTLDAHGLTRLVAVCAACLYLFALVAGLAWRADQRRRPIEPMPRRNHR